MRGLVAVLLLAAASAKNVPWVPEVNCTGGKVVKMEVEVANVTVQGVVQFTTRVYRIDGQISFPSATLRMQAGQRCSLRVINKLPGTACTIHSNGFHCPDTTSLHTHGVHVSPNEDNIDTHIEPGQEHTYTYNIPSDHLLGTHWYHAHHHGSTALQALGGLAGILLMDPSPNFTLPSDFARLYDRPTVPPMMLNYLAFGNTTGPVNLWNFFTHKDLVNQYNPVTVPLNLSWTGVVPNRHTGNFYTVNGEFMPDVQMVSGDATLLQMVHAGDGDHLCLEIDDPAKECNVTLLARDGVFHQTPFLQLRTIVLLQGTRVDLAVQCTLPAGVTEKKFNLRATAKPYVNPAAINVFKQATMMTLVVKANTSATPVPVPTSEVTLPGYLQSLMNSTAVQVGGETGVRTIDFDMGPNENAVNGVVWPGWKYTGRGKYVEEYCLDKTYEMTLGLPDPAHNPDGPVMAFFFHPYHQHVNHFQVVDGRDNTGAVMRNGEWRDVVPSWGTVMRFRPATYTGDAVVHCHLLQHEDHGMMSLMKLSRCSGDAARPRPPSVNPSPLLLPAFNSTGSVSNKLVIALLLVAVGLLLFLLVKERHFKKPVEQVGQAKSEPAACEMAVTDPHQDANMTL